MSLTKHPLALGRVAGGNHLVAQQDEPEPFQFTEQELLEADLARNVDKGSRLAIGTPSRCTRSAIMNLYEIVIGKKGSPRLQFAAMAPSSGEAVEQHLCLALDDERVEAWAVGKRPAPFNVMAERNALECARMNDARARALDIQHLDVLRRVGAI